MKKILWYSLEWKNIVMNAAILIGVHLMGVILHEIIMATSGADTTFPMGTFMSFMAIAFLGLFANWSDEVLRFNLAISMGETRHRFFLSFMIQYFVLLLFDWALMYAMARIEILRLEHMYSNLPVEDFVVGAFHPISFLLVPLGLLGLGMLIGGLGLKFGSNSKWFIVGGWVLICIGMSRIEEGRLLVKFLNLPAYAYAIIAVAISIAMIIAAALMIRRQRVDI